MFFGGPKKGTSAREKTYPNMKISMILRSAGGRGVSTQTRENRKEQRGGRSAHKLKAREEKATKKQGTAREARRRKKQGTAREARSIKNAQRARSARCARAEKVLFTAKVCFMLTSPSRVFTHTERLTETSSTGVSGLISTSQNTPTMRPSARGGPKFFDPTDQNPAPPANFGTHHFWSGALLIPHPALPETTCLCCVQCGAWPLCS